MPIQESASVCKISPKNSLTKNVALLRLREREVLAYHYICEVFRAQGHLTAEKLKLLKEIASALYIPEVRHRAECLQAICNKELNDIAEWVAGPGTDVEWRKESTDMTPGPPLGRILTSNLRLANAIGKAVREQMDKMDDDESVVVKTITVSGSLDESDFEEPVPVQKKNKASKIADVEEELPKDEEDSKDEDKDGDTSSSISSISDDSQSKEEPNKSDSQKMETSKEETDATLMPPPPPVILVPSPTHPPLSTPTTSLPSPPPPVITVPPPSDMIVASTPTTIAVSETPVHTEIPQIIKTPIADAPSLSEAEEAQARADFFSSLPPLVVVPPPDPSETCHFPSPTQSSPSLVLSPGMSIQIRDDTKKRKRSVSHSHDASSTAVTGAKTMAFSSYSKVTPVMVSAASVTSQSQVKVTPIISRAKMATTPQAQKVIIVSNNPSAATPILQRSLNVPMGTLGLPVIRTNQPRFQAVSGSSASTIRPKMVTVPAKCRAKGSSMVNLQLKNAITLKQDNVTVVDTSAKRLQGQTKILPKPSGSMFIVNTGHGTHKLATTMAGGSQGSKQNVVIVQKGGNQRTLTLSNPNKELMQKLMSKKCVVIQSSKMVPKTISPKPSPPPPPPPPPAPPPSLTQTPQQIPPVITTAGNTLVLDLSQEQDSKNWGGTTLREILQASGIITSTSQTISAPTVADSTPVTTSEGEWLPVETSKSLSLEEVSLPLGQSESFVTLDEAVEMLEDQTLEGAASGSEGTHTFTPSEQMFTITSDQLSSGTLNVVAEKSDEIVINALPSEVAPDLDSVSQPFMPHKDGAVTIQHSLIDVPANMSLEDYSSQQMENQNFN